MRLSPVETVISHMEDDVKIHGIAEEQSAAIIVIEGIKYLVTIVRMPTKLEVN